jgi:hypothetical protein
MRGMRFSMIACAGEVKFQAIEAFRRSNGLLYHALNCSPRQFEAPLNRYSRLHLDQTALLDVECGLKI